MLAAKNQDPRQIRNKGLIFYVATGGGAANANRPFSNTTGRYLNRNAKIDSNTAQWLMA